MWIEEFESTGRIEFFRSWHFGDIHNFSQLVRKALQSGSVRRFLPGVLSTVVIKELA